jgi:GAF domain-containing protein
MTSEATQDSPDKLGGSEIPGDIANQLSELARTLQADSDTESVLEDIVCTAIRLIPHAAEASISLVRARRTIESFAASSDLPRDVDAVQSETRQGPCLDAAYTEQIVRVPNLSKEPRWPKFAERAWDLGARSMLSFQLFVEGDNLGALNVYGDDVNVFDEECEQIGLLIAAHAAVAFADSQEIKQLNDALTTRDLIGQAKGILMERHKISAHQAFTLLTTVSANTNIKLIHIAEHLAVSGELATSKKPKSTTSIEDGNAGQLELPASTIANFAPPSSHPASGKGEACSCGGEVCSAVMASAGSPP